MLIKAQAHRGLINENSSDSRNWRFWGNYEGELLRALNVWWLNYKDSESLQALPHMGIGALITAANIVSPHYGNSPVVLPATNQGMQSGGNETTASDFADVPHHPGPYTDVPSWMSCADYSKHEQRQPKRTRSTQNVSAEVPRPVIAQKEIPLKRYKMKIGNLSNDSPFCEIGTDDLLEGKSPTNFQLQ